MRPQPEQIGRLLTRDLTGTTIVSLAAFFSAHESVPADLAVGRVSAELVAPYPPGIPVLAPGELVTEALLAGLRAVAADGVRVAYASDPTLARLEVVRA